MKFQILEQRIFGDMTALWFTHDGKVGFSLIPAGMENKIAQHRENLNDTVAYRGIHRALKCDSIATHAESAIQFKIAGDAYWDNFSAGSTMRNSESVDLLKHYELLPLEDGMKLVMRDERGLELTQTVRYTAGDTFVRVATSVTNKGTDAVNLEYLASFSLGMLSPFHKDDGCGTYEVLRWHSYWSNEGRLEQRSIEELGLEMSWGTYGVRTLRFGEQGSMPVREYFPQVGFYDRETGVVWGAVLNVFGSWELEVSRRSDFFNISGGLVDREFGHWKKTLSPGETLESPAAAITCAKGDAETLQNRLTPFGEGEVPASEEDLPVMFNDWCTTWGKPFPSNLLPIADRLKGRDIRYFVLDAGWFSGPKGWTTGIGDWEVPPGNYPEGLKYFSDQIREKGFIPGIWFEFEVVTTDSRIYAEHPEMLLHLDGKVLRSGPRCFLDLRKPEVVERLSEKVIRFLKGNGFGYMKVDYNAPTGFGCDGAESEAEALRQHILGVECFFRKLRRELPELVLEICSSGGHRLTSAWMNLASMGSFSDAHEGVEIPIIGANTANLIPVRKNQIWAVLHPEDDEKRFFYSLSAGFLGRLCLSGDIAPLSAEQSAWVDRACSLYKKSVPALKKGTNKLTREIGLSYTRPTGYQAFTRTGADCKVVVVHTFANAPASLSIPLESGWKLDDAFAPSGVRYKAENELNLENLSDFQGMVFLLKKQ